MLEAAAEKLQAALLASLEDEKPESAQQQAKAKRKKEKKGRRTKKTAAQSEPAKHGSNRAESCNPSSDISSSEHFPAHADEDVCQQQGQSSDAAAKADDLGSAVAEESQPTESASRASAETFSRHAHSSSGEEEHTHNFALGLVGATASEDEWKVGAHEIRLACLVIWTICTLMRSIWGLQAGPTHGMFCRMQADPVTQPEYDSGDDSHLHADCWEGDKEGGIQSEFSLTLCSASSSAAAAQAQSAAEPEGLQALSITGVPDGVLRHSRVYRVRPQRAECGHNTPIWSPPQTPDARRETLGSAKCFQCSTPAGVSS